MPEKFSSFFTNRRNFSRLLATTALVPLALTAGELENDNTNKQIMAETAEKLIREQVLTPLIHQHNNFKNNLEQDGHNVSTYGLWHTVQLNGLLQTLAGANRNPWVDQHSIPYLYESISTLKQRSQEQRLPAYNKDIAAEFWGNVLNLSSVWAAHNAHTDLESLSASNLHPLKKASRRKFMQIAGTVATAGSIAGATAIVSNPLNFDMKNHPDYISVPSPVLKNLSYPDQYTAFINFYKSSLASVPSFEETQLMPQDEYYSRWEQQRTKYQDAWQAQTSDQERNKILQKANYLLTCSYSAYKERYELLQDTELPYFRHIIAAHPENPLLSFQDETYPDITNTGFGLQLLQLTRQNQPNMDLDLK